MPAVNMYIIYLTIVNLSKDRWLTILKWMRMNRKLVCITPGQSVLSLSFPLWRLCISLSVFTRRRKAASPILTVMCFALSPDMMATVRICVAIHTDVSQGDGVPNGQDSPRMSVLTDGVTAKRKRAMSLQCVDGCSGATTYRRFPTAYCCSKPWQTLPFSFTFPHVLPDILQESRS